MFESRDPTPQVPAASPAAPNPLLRERILAAAKAQPAAPRPKHLRKTQLVVGLSWIVAFAVFLLAGGPRPSGRPLALLIGTASGTATIVAVCVWALLTRGPSSLGRGRQLLWSVALGAVPAILFWKIIWSMGFSGALDEWPTRPGLRCLGLTLGIAVCPLLAFVLTRRSSDPKHPALTGFAAGVGIGAASTLLTDLWCPVAFIPHLLLGHALPVALLGGVGALLGVFFIQLSEKR